MENKFKFDENFLDKVKRISRSVLFLSGVLATLSLLNYLATFFGSKDVFFEALRMKVPSAVGVLAVVYLSLSGHKITKSFSLKNAFEAALLFLVFAMAVVTFLSYPRWVIPQTSPFFISLFVSTCIFLFGITLLLRKVLGSRFAKTYQLINAVNLTLSTTALLGFLIEARSVQALLFFNQMTICCAVNLAMCSFAFYFTEPEEGWMPIFTSDNIGSQMLRKALKICFPVIALLVWALTRGMLIGLYDHNFRFDLLVVGSFLIFGAALLVIGKHLNTVDRKHQMALDEVRMGQEDLWAAQSLAKVGSWTLSLDDLKAKCSPQLYEIFGIPKDEVLELSGVSRFLSPEDSEILQTGIMKCAEFGIPLDIQHKIIRADKTERMVRGRGELRKNNVSNKMEVHGTIHDITESHRILEQLSAAERLYTDLYNEAPDMLLSVERSTGKVIKCNKTLLRNLGYEIDEVVGHHISNLYSPRCLDKLGGLTQEFYSTGSLQNKELIVLTKDGRELDVSLSSSAVRDENGEIVWSRSIWRDISDIKKARELLIRERAAEEGSRLKSNFVATMSHEIRTPLNAVVGLTEVLLETNLNPVQRDYVDTLKQSADTLLVLVNEVLDFSKIESGKIELSLSDFFLNDFMEDVKKQMSWSAARKGLPLNFSTSYPPGMVFVGDQNRIKQILINLISNAIKFTDTGSVDIAAHAIQVDDGMAKLTLSVCDSGIGMSGEDLGHLFKPFSQLDSSISRRFGGTGLGLSISQGLANAMGCQIYVESELGKGSKFFLELKLEIHPAREKREGDAVTTLSKPAFLARVLVAEDIDTNRKVIEIMLRNFGCEVVFASNGVEAVSLAEQQKFDLIFMDCHMPIMDGLEATRAIRSNPKLGQNQPPIVALTANATTADRIACDLAGMTDFLIKPVTKSSLGAVLQKLLPSVSGSAEQYVENLKQKRDETMSFLDTNVLEELKHIDEGNHRSLVFDLLDLFESKVPERIQKLNLSLDQQDWLESVKNAHAVKSSASPLGAHAIARTCDDISGLVRIGNYVEAKSLMDLLHTQCKGLRGHLQSWQSDRHS